VKRGDQNSKVKHIVFLTKYRFYVGAAPITFTTRVL